MIFHNPKTKGLDVTVLIISHLYCHFKHPNRVLSEFILLASYTLDSFFFPLMNSTQP